MKKLMLAASAFIVLLLMAVSPGKGDTAAWIRINQLGYTPGGIKVAVWCSNLPQPVHTFQLVNAATGNVVFAARAGKAFGKYGPFAQSQRLDFTSFRTPGTYYVRAGQAVSPVFRINDHVYDRAADFCLRYMRQQRCGFNPFLKDSCHTQDGYSLYGETAGLKDSTHIDATGGWHDASDYLQYVTTSANATYHLLMAHRDFPGVFGDEKLSNGLDGRNGLADVLDEAKWGLDWLLKMHPREDWMFNQVADDRDHVRMRLPGMDSFYGKGFERPVYFLTGEPQQRGRFMNDTRGTTSTAAKMFSAFALGSTVFAAVREQYADSLQWRSLTAYHYTSRKRGVTQTASVKSPYIYAEENWVDDMELAFAAMQAAFTAPGAPGVSDINVSPDDQTGTAILDSALYFARQEPITPWLGADTARHYQWYPFVNVGHYELARQLQGKKRDTVTGYYRKGIEKIWRKARQNAFYRGVPFIWCSNNLTVAFATQCYWYRTLTGDQSFVQLEQANFDWLFGCNPWGTSMVYGLPATGDTPADPHSAFTHLKNFPIDGGLVDGPVYASIYNNLIGIRLYQPDEYARFNQNNLAVYHDDYGDYSTNEPTMDGTASLIYLLAAKQAEALKAKTPAKPVK